MGIVAITIAYLLQSKIAVILVGQVYVAAAEIGALTGSVLGPIAAWTLMRCVPIWKALAGTAAGSTIGFVLGYWLGWRYQEPLWTLAGTLLGFILASILLRLTSSSRVEAVPEGGR